MCPNFRPLQLPLTLVLILSLASLAFATDKKRKVEENTKDKAKTAQKSDPKQLAKAAKEKDSKNKQQLAKNKKSQDEDEKNKRNKRLSKADVKIAAKQHEEKSKQQKDKAEKVKDKKDKTAKRESERDKKKQELAAKKISATKDKLAKSFVKSENKSERKASPDKHEAKAKVEKESKSAIEIAKDANAAKLLAKAQLKATFPAKTNYQSKALAEEKIKELPSSKFTLRPIAKIIPKVELKFSIAKALAVNSFDPPPPRETGPDIIEVIEDNSLEARKLDELYRQEVRSLQFSNIPNVSNKRMDLKKMDAERISQIQEVLARKGYYLGATTGIYDDQTLNAMRKFQEDHKIDVTGYATAHTLKLLGLTDWERHDE